eukprot:12404221-Karenia_brevis.AAC.1
MKKARQPHLILIFAPCLSGSSCLELLATLVRNTVFKLPAQMDHTDAVMKYRRDHLEDLRVEATALDVGTPVEIQGLVTRVDLNGRCGVIDDWSNEHNRWVVTVKGSGKLRREIVRLKPENLRNNEDSNTIKNRISSLAREAFRKMKEQERGTTSERKKAARKLVAEERAAAASDMSLTYQDRFMVAQQRASQRLEGMHGEDIRAL